MIRRVIQAGSFILDFFLPRRCVSCNRRLHPGEVLLCSPCMLDNASVGAFKDSHNNRMLSLVTGMAMIIKANALIYYRPESDLADIIYKIKYGGRQDVAFLLGQHMAKVFQTQSFFDDIDAIVPVPVSKMRRMKRGYNQSEIISKGVAEITRIEVVTDAVVRRKFTVSQTSLFGSERRNNVKDVFAVKDAGQLNDKHILIIDDVFTTGATISSLIDVINRHTDNVRFSVLTVGFTKS